MRRPGLPEALAVAALLGALAPLLAWLYYSVQPAWVATGGHVTSGSVELLHYNATDVRPKVNLTYEYDVLGNTFAGRFEGLWPETHSPNALLPADLKYLAQPGYTLVVLYDPANPDESRLHYLGNEESMPYALLSIAGFIVAGAYCLFVYPAWRSQ
ncbi:MAG: hypothetical protein AMXMBFR84_03900 [Candidatus Hydrogenedentota bacterium]